MLFNIIYHKGFYVQILVSRPLFEGQGTEMLKIFHHIYFFCGAAAPVGLRLPQF
jgi:hypothetical protein